MSDPTPNNLIMAYLLLREPKLMGRVKVETRIYSTESQRLFAVRRRGATVKVTFQAPFTREDFEEIIRRCAAACLEVLHEQTHAVEVALTINGLEETSEARD